MLLLLCADKRIFRKKAPATGGERSFVKFILEPLYKIYAQVSHQLNSCYDIFSAVASHRWTGIVSIVPPSPHSFTLVFPDSPRLASAFVYIQYTCAMLTQGCMHAGTWRA